MIETEARVLAVGDGHAVVEPRPHSPCGQCDPKHGCRSVQIARLFTLREPAFRVLDPLGVAVGDRVDVAVPESGMLHSAGLLYGLPLGGLLAGAMLGALWGELAAVLLSLTALAGCLFWARHLARRRAGDARFQPHITRRLSDHVIFMETQKTCRSRS